MARVTEDVMWQGERLIRFSRRLRGLSYRQAGGLGVLALLSLGVVVASAAGLVALAPSLLGVLLTAALVGVVHLSRRIGGLHRANQAAVADLRVVMDQLQRRVVGAVEKERLAAGDRHLEVVDALARVRPGGEDDATPPRGAAGSRCGCGGTPFQPPHPPPKAD